MNLENLIKASFATIATVATTLLGGWDMTIQVLVFMLVLDWLTGVAKAFINKEVSSEVGARGIVKKIMILAVVAVAAQLDRTLNTSAQLFRTAVTYFYIANEGISLLENLAASGIPLPKILTDRLVQLKTQLEEERNDING